jgi:hypothetical protein
MRFSRDFVFAIFPDYFLGFLESSSLPVLKPAAMSHTSDEVFEPTVICCSRQ